MTHLSTESFVYSLPVIPQATREDFIRTARMLKERAGIVLGEHKEDMVARSLGLETKNLGVAEVRQYLDFLDHNPRAPEWERFVNTFTINHTAFFRESHHFVSLAEFVKKRSKPLSVWCAAASTGEEVYTIAMVLQENVSNAEISCSLLASDIDTQALVRAEEGVYSLDRVQPVEESLLRKYFQRGVGKRAGMVRVKPVLRNMVDFRMINLVSSENWPTDQSFDVVFCRNTMIYFEKETQSKLLDKFAQVMKPGALLFVGHSENISHLSKAFRLQGQTVYVRV
ncbi:CheR family methyltransferase [Paenalcaligenes suwonensis]|uniref:CheR family methyltransferase n=1 Tax=Paenalcaligenes suwonensis TaxID=1202713 RepID=UPI0014099C97|nr:CheR family methyltransferase [Paenalcaligenes suwonensis]NHC61860.1 methyltransferase domain-containing protein [Paenalcaligenes suwonensis]